MPVAIVWLAVALVFAVVEVATVALFGGFVTLGALAAAVAAFVGADILTQAIVFAIVSTLGLVIVLLIIVLAVLVIARTIRVIQQGSVGVVKRLGQFHAVRNPGITFLLPFADVMELVDMRETPRTGDRQDVISKDNVSLQVNATIFSQVVDPQAALFGVSNYHVAVDN